MLIEAFFEHVNPLCPLLHKGMFITLLWQGRHKVDRHFYSLVLMVLALASRTVLDTRVRTDPEDHCSAGRGFFEMAGSVNRDGLWVSGGLFGLQARVVSEDGSLLALHTLIRKLSPILLFLPPFAAGHVIPVGNLCPIDLLGGAWGGNYDGARSWCPSPRTVATEPHRPIVEATVVHSVRDGPRPERRARATLYDSRCLVRLFLSTDGGGN